MPPRSIDRVQDSVRPSPVAAGPSLPTFASTLVGTLQRWTELGKGGRRAFFFFPGPARLRRALLAARRPRPVDGRCSPLSRDIETADLTMSCGEEGGERGARRRFGECAHARLRTHGLGGPDGLGLHHANSRGAARAFGPRAGRLGVDPHKDNVEPPRRLFIPTQPTHSEEVSDGQVSEERGTRPRQGPVHWCASRQMVRDFQTHMLGLAMRAPLVAGANGGRPGRGLSLR